MARLARLTVAGLAHLVSMRALAQRPIVRDDHDRLACLAALREASLLNRVAVHAYALLDDGLRLLATPPDATALGRMVQDFGRRYVVAFNRRHGQRGTLWEGRFRAAVLQPGALACDALVFVESEPVRAGLADFAGDFSWSSAAHHLGRQRDPLVTAMLEYWQLGNTPFERETAWQLRLAEGLPAQQVQSLEEASDKGWALGDEAFLTQLAMQTGRPSRPRSRGRPAARPS